MEILFLAPLLLEYKFVAETEGHVLLDSNVTCSLENRGRRCSEHKE
jgi:hypothetical protein